MTTPTSTRWVRGDHGGATPKPKIRQAGPKPDLGRSGFPHSPDPGAPGPWPMTLLLYLERVLWLSLPIPVPCIWRSPTH